MRVDGAWSDRLVRNDGLGVAGCILSPLLFNIKLATKELKQSDNFVYLGGIISSDSSCDRDVARRIGIASGVVRNLDDIWKSKEITADTKVKL